MILRCTSVDPIVPEAEEKQRESERRTYLQQGQVQVNEKYEFRKIGMSVKDETLRYESLKVVRKRSSPILSDSSSDGVGRFFDVIL